MDILKLVELSTGDIAYRYEKSIVLFFAGKRKVLSTSLYNGGYREELVAVFNHDGTIGAGIGFKMLADSYDEHMRLIAQKIGLDPNKVSGMGTAANMDNVAISMLKYEDLTVTAIVTGGIEINGGRVGDPSDFYKPTEKPAKLGTINIMLVIDADMPAGAIARALVTCTEAKTAAIQELLAGSNYSYGLATGSGTDQTIVVANSMSALYMESAGKHSKLGELIGKTVIQAVKEALSKQSGLNPKNQHDVFKRLKRFQINTESLWQQYLQIAATPVIKPQFLEICEIYAKKESLVVPISLLAHLLDQFNWGLLNATECDLWLNKILMQIATEFQIELKLEQASNLKDFLTKIEAALLQLLIDKLAVEQ